MTDGDQKVRICEMVASLGAVIAFAEAQDDHVLAAKCEDVRIMLLDRLPSTLRF